MALNNFRGKFANSLRSEFPHEDYEPLSEIYLYEGAGDSELDNDIRSAVDEKIIIDDPSFPWLIFLLALGKDLLDIFTGGIISIIASASIGFVLWLWWFTKSSFIRKKIRKWVTKRIILFLVGDSIPVVSVFVPTSLFIVLWYHREKKIVKLLSQLISVYGVTAKLSAQAQKTQRNTATNSQKTTTAQKRTA